MDTLSSAELADQLGDSSRPLYVALEGALLSGDVLWERLLVVLKQRPWLLLMLPLWLLGGRTRLQRVVDERSSLDGAALPYRRDLLEALRAAAVRGRSVSLVASNAEMGSAAAAHLGFFAGVIHDSARRRAPDALVARLGPRFDFIGQSRADLPLLVNAECGYAVGAGSSVVQRARDSAGKIQVLSKRRSRARSTVKVMRPHQWSKNALVVVPIALSPSGHSMTQIVAGVLAAVSFSLCASAGYVFNDLIDIDADRAHRTKYRRPFASGDLPVLFGPPLFVALFGASFAIAFLALPLPFVGMLAIYFIATMSYSLVLKSKLMVDVVVLAGLYTHRVLAGGIATGIVISAWLLAFSLFMFSSLAFCKRYVELRHSLATGGQLKSRGYHTGDAEMVASMGPTAGYMAVLLFCLFIDSDSVTAAYRRPTLLWFIVPVLLYWVSRVWFLAHRGQMQDDPVKFALTDRLSWACAALAALFAGAARFVGP